MATIIISTLFCDCSNTKIFFTKTKKGKKIIKRNKNIFNYKKSKNLAFLLIALLEEPSL
jgi:hypothetical protein